ncbi:hypothetical protein [Cryobacterium sp. GrIS_2_6]|uniref:hypothetical protein n=1 Tax=Cryobacterium sp. GrIS_2_6 TaxID=3162785 RepID=UPI002DFCFEC8|nr:hypothetical protein [Cryobacterium psychrotolerans]MEC5149239.1 hypothetical protein [Cryobacterium psychrotolerans]MEC5149317.1 hypothetical protein [Cryobacterium psychrotolerans]
MKTSHARAIRAGIEDARAGYWDNREGSLLLSFTEYQPRLYSAAWERTSRKPPHATPVKPPWLTDNTSRTNAHTNAPETLSTCTRCVLAIIGGSTLTYDQLLAAHTDAIHGAHE